MNYIQVFASDRSRTTRRTPTASSWPSRRSIAARSSRNDRTPLAISRETEPRVHLPAPLPGGELYAHLTGYYSVLRPNRAGAIFGDYLSGDAPELLPQTIGDFIQGNPKVARRSSPRSIRSSSGSRWHRRGSRRWRTAARSSRWNPTTGRCWRSPRTRPSTRTRSRRTTRRPRRRPPQALNGDPEKPLLSRASDELFPPGSMFKIITAATALENGYHAPGPCAQPAGHSTSRTPTTRWRTSEDRSVPGDPDHPGRGASGFVQCGVRRSRPGTRAEEDRRAGREVRILSIAFPWPVSDRHGPVRHPLFGRSLSEPANFEDKTRSRLLRYRAVRRGDEPALDGAGRVGDRERRRPDAASARARGPRPPGDARSTFRTRGSLRPSRYPPETASELTYMMESVVAAGTGPRQVSDPRRDRRRKTGTAQGGEAEYPHAWFVLVRSGGGSPGRRSGYRSRRG